MPHFDSQNSFLLKQPKASIPAKKPFSEDRHSEAWSHRAARRAFEANANSNIGIEFAVCFQSHRFMKFNDEPYPQLRGEDWIDGRGRDGQTSRARDYERVVDPKYLDQIRTQAAQLSRIRNVQRD